MFGKEMTFLSRGSGGVPHSPPSGGTIGGKKRNREPSPLHLVYLFVHSCKPQGAGCACDRKQSFPTPHNGEAIGTDPESVN